MTIFLQRRVYSSHNLTVHELSAFLLNLRPGVFQADRPVKDEFLRCGIRIDGEVALPLKLITAAAWRAFYKWFNLAACQHFERIRIQVNQEIFAFSSIFGKRLREQII